MTLRFRGTGTAGQRFVESIKVVLPGAADPAKARSHILVSSGLGLSKVFFVYSTICFHSPFLLGRIIPPSIAPTIAA